MAEWHDPTRHSGFDHEAHKKERNQRILNTVGMAANVGLAGLGAYHLGRSLLKKAPVHTTPFISHSHLEVAPHRHAIPKSAHLTAKTSKVKIKLKRK